jgi:hypothetical protein
MLLYSAIGQWTYSSRITYSFIPDGTAIPGTSGSVMFQKFNAIAPTATWEAAIEAAASTWEAGANAQLALVSETGQNAIGASGDEQGDSRFGDIRIGAAPLASGVLAETFLPPASNGSSIAGDIIFNSNVNYRVNNGGIDLQTVALHEFGHALGLGDQSADPNSAMYYNFNGVKTSLDADDLIGIQSIYGAPQYDRFNQGLIKNGSVLTATNILPYLNGSNDQIVLPGLMNTTAGQQEDYSLVVPSGAAATMTVTVQSSNLSSFAPGLYVLNSSLQFVAQVTAPATYGATLTTATIPVTAGQKYYIKVASAGTYGRVGTYGLEVNLGTQSLSPFAPPNTVVAQQADRGGGLTNALTVGGARVVAPASSPGLTWATLGNYTGWIEQYTVGSGTPDSPVAQPPAPSGPVASSPGDPGPAAPVIVGPVSPPSVPAATPAATGSAPAGSGVPIGPLPASVSSTISTSTPRHKHAHHAVDATLRGWTGHRHRPQSGSRLRHARHGHDALS